MRGTPTSTVRPPIRRRRRPEPRFGDPMRLSQCFNFHDFRRLAKPRLPAPIFNYIDGAAEDETTYRRNTEAFETCDLVPKKHTNDTKDNKTVTVLGEKLAVPFYC